MEATTCHTCQTEAKRERGEETTTRENNRAAMWGCTCDPATSAEAQAWMDRMTR